MSIQSSHPSTAHNISRSSFFGYSKKEYIQYIPVLHQGLVWILFGHILAKWPQSRYAEAQPVGNQSGSGQCMAVHQTKSLLTDGYVSYDDQ